MTNQECKIRPEIITFNSNEPSFYPYSIEVNKGSGSCNNIDDPYAKLCVPVVLKQDIQNGMKLCNNKQLWNKDKCRCECKEID